MMEAPTNLNATAPTHRI